MKSFKHVNAKSAKEAAKLLKKNKGKARLLAGGTDLLGILKDKLLPDHPELIINLKTIRKLYGIREESGHVTIGAMTKLSDIVASPIIKEKYKMLADAAETVATPLIRNLGTIGGNLCQEVRCWYYRYPHAIGGRVLCARKRAGQHDTPDDNRVIEGKGCSAMTGENRYHSLFGAARMGDTPCTIYCPAGIHIPHYMSKIREGRLMEAALKLLQTNPMPAVTGRVCPHDCQEGCNRGEYDASVSIRDVERFMGDYILEHAGELLVPPVSETGKRVAVVGAGPAGLSAAFYLRRAGHRVTVFDRLGEPGGMLAHAIPVFRLPAECNRRLITAYQNMGIDFKPHVDVGKDIKLGDLRKEWDAIFLATGAWAAPSIGIEGEDLTTPGLTFLNDVRRGIKENPGKRVLVVGGGNVAVDVGITTRRLGADQVTLVCLESREEMPALKWEVEKAIEEGINLVNSNGPSRIYKNQQNALCVDMVRCVSVFDDKGRFAPVCEDTVLDTLEADRVIFAVGQVPDLAYLKGTSHIKTDRNRIRVDKESHGTGLNGVFAGGDVTTGPATVVKALAAGRREAEAIDQFLGGDQKQPESDEEQLGEPLLSFNNQYLEKTSPVNMPERPVQERQIDLEDTLGLDLDSIRTEANRCFNCGCVAVNASDLAPVLVALDAKIKTTNRTISAEAFFSMGSMKPMIIAPDEVLSEIIIPDRGNHIKCAYDKFRIRRTVDFPIVSVASAYEMDVGRFKDARIVLGAVAPVPIRLRETEEFLKGKEACKEVAEQGAAIAAEKAIPLAENAYKVQIMKTLVKRSIMAMI